MLCQRRDRGWWLVRGDQRPVRQQLVLVQRSPLEDLPEYPRRQCPGQQAEGVDADRRGLPGIARVEVRERVVVVIHGDDDAEEDANPWHANRSCRTAVTPRVLVTIDTEPDGERRHRGVARPRVHSVQVC
jgi:hypothetical protein